MAGTGPSIPVTPLARSVRDTAAILDAVAGEMPGDPYTAPPPRRPFLQEVGADPGRLRIGVLVVAPGGTADTHPDCLAAVESTRTLLDSLGHEVVDEAPEGIEDPEYISQFLTQWGAGVAWNLAYWSRKTGRPITAEDVEPLTWALAEAGRSYSAPQLFQALEWLETSTRRFGGWFADGGFDLLLTPTLAEPPPRIGEMASDPDNPWGPIFRAASVTPFTPLANVSGQPAMSVPLHWNDEGLPIGVQFFARYGREDVLLRLAAQLEEARPWKDRLPPIHA